MQSLLHGPRRLGGRQAGAAAGRWRVNCVHRPIGGVVAYSRMFGPGLDHEEPEFATDGDARLQLSDVGKLVRRTQRRIVGAARAEDRVTFAKLIREHLGTDGSSVDVVEETWPSYEHVNVQVGLDAWLEASGPQPHARRRGELPAPRVRPVRPHALVGAGRTTRPRSRQRGAGSTCRSGPSGEVRACVVCAVYLVTEGDRRAVLLLRIGRVGHGRARRAGSRSPPRTRTSPPGSPWRSGQSALEHNVYRRQVVSFGRRHVRRARDRALPSITARPCRSTT